MNTLMKLTKQFDSDWYMSLEACPGPILGSIRHCYLVQWGF